MSFEISLSAERNIDGLFKEIQAEFNRKGVIAQTELLEKNVMVYSDTKQANNVKNAVAEAATRFIIEEFEPKEIERLVKEGYSFFTRDEKSQLIDAIENVLDGNGEDIVGSLFMIRRRCIISKKLMEYFEIKNKLLVDGFLPFRLKDYLTELEDFVDRSADEFLMQKKYQEFLGLLKFFVQMQEPKINKVNVIACDNGVYLLLDDDGKELKDEDIYEFTKELNIGALSSEDMLISSLISICPINITVHNYSAGRAELLETLRNIFAGRMSFCSNCDFCRLGNSGKYLN